jgi:hypothetical protein
VYSESSLRGYQVDIEFRDRLLRLGIDSLEVRRLRQDLVYVYKVVFGLVGHACDGLFQLANTVHSPYTRGHPYKLYPHYCRVDVRKYFSLKELSAYGIIHLQMKHILAILLFLKTLFATSILRASFHWVFSSCLFQHNSRCLIIRPTYNYFVMKYIVMKCILEPVLAFVLIVQCSILTVSLYCIFLLNE